MKQNRSANVSEVVEAEYHHDGEEVDDWNRKNAFLFNGA